MTSKRAATVSPLRKRGGYSGSKPGSQMRPPIQTPSATVSRPRPSSNGSGKK
jgi:hypothetical protein